MDDYISREAALNIFQTWRSDLTQQIEGSVAFPHTRSDLKVCRTQLDDCIHALRDIPAADVRPVVFCKDCEFLKVGKVSMACAKGILSFIYQSDYCSRGKRRTYNGE